MFFGFFADWIPIFGKEHDQYAPLSFFRTSYSRLVMSHIDLFDPLNLEFFNGVSANSYSDVLSHVLGNWPGFDLSGWRLGNVGPRSGASLRLRPLLSFSNSKRRLFR